MADTERNGETAAPHLCGKRSDSGCFDARGRSAPFPLSRFYLESDTERQRKKRGLVLFFSGAVLSAFALTFPLFLLLDISHIISSLLVINELRQDNFIR